MQVEEINTRTEENILREEQKMKNMRKVSVEKDSGINLEEIKIAPDK